MDANALIPLLLAFFAMVVLFMAAVPLAFCYLTPVSVAIKEVRKAPGEVYNFFKVAVFVPALIIAYSYTVADTGDILASDTCRILICWSGALFSRFSSRENSFYRYTFWLYTLMASAIWLSGNQSWWGAGDGFVGPT